MLGIYELTNVDAYLSEVELRLKRQHPGVEFAYAGCIDRGVPTLTVAVKNSDGHTPLPGVTGDTLEIILAYARELNKRRLDLLPRSAAAVVASTMGGVNRRGWSTV